ncbi:MAG TPA: hypothetical protein HA222_05415 [Candidatus Diapherotrites archaeon]|uniref:Uncharacterized protein n=1 Tax=Candidatus Iainarchaeum sp. TaxID=3101447 RepID=A0A7J4JX73_9ARCH|nr:hypothetical protein [Candidatus Diapherotrites archaeon]
MLWCVMAYATTIQLNKETKARLESLKNYRRETFDEVVSKLLALVPEGDEEGKYTEEFRAGLLESLYESKLGKTVSLAQVKKELKM